MDPRPTGEFEKAAREQSGGNVLSELWLFLRDNKKWWLLPILLVLAVLAMLTFFAGSGAAPFIYTMF